MNISLQDLKKLKWEVNQKIYQHVYNSGFDNPKKTYIIFTDFVGNGSNDHGLPYSIIFTPTIKGYGEPTTSQIILKTFIQAQGACGKKAHKKDAMHTKTADILKKNDSSSIIDKKITPTIDIMSKDALIW